MLEGFYFGLVTYGDRGDLFLDFLKDILDKLPGVKCIIVLNGVEPNTKNGIYELLSIYPDRCFVWESEFNLGSAGGFSSLISMAKDIPDCSRLLILDDDTRISINNIIKLSRMDGKYLLYACYRNDRKYMRILKNGCDPKNFFAEKSSFLGFGIKRIIKRILPVKSSPVVSDSYVLPWSTYSGLFLSRSVYIDEDLPREDFYLYADDTEYTSRLSKKYGLTLLCDVEVIDDESSWNVGRENIFQRILNGKDDFRVFYSVRNQVYLDFYCFRGGFFSFLFNFFVFNVFFIIYFFYSYLLSGLSSRRIFRFFLYVKAVYFGLKGVLGKIEI